MTLTDLRGGRPRAGALAGALLALSLPGTATPLLAQFAAIQPGQTVSGQLGSGDPSSSARGPFKVYQFQGRSGERFTATLRSGEFDAYLRLLRPVGGITDELESDDDAGGDTDARVRFTLEADGSYLLVAQALEPESGGAFTLVLEPAATPTTADPRPIRLGQTVSGELAETDAVQEDDDTFYDTWTIAATAGQRLVVVMESDAVDSFLSIGRTLPDGGFESLASNDDGGQPGDETNSRMRVRIPEEGTFEIRANSVSVATGAYRLTVFEGPEPPATASEHPIGAGEEETGTLDDADAVLDDETYYEYWIYEGRAGDRLTVRMASEDFDTFVAIGRLSGGDFQELESNDDESDNSTDSQIEITLPQDGRYAIRAGALNAGQGGDYTVAVTRGR